VSESGKTHARAFVSIQEQCAAFQFETATGTFLRNLPVCPIGFATLEIETPNARDHPAGISILLTLFRQQDLSESVLSRSKSFGWTNLAASYLE
jgi:hypothetical protein